MVYEVLYPKCQLHVTRLEAFQSGVVHETLLSSSPRGDVFLSFFPNLRNSSGKRCLPPLLN